MNGQILQDAEAKYKRNIANDHNVYDSELALRLVAALRDARLEIDRLRLTVIRLEASKR